MSSSSLSDSYQDQWTRRTEFSEPNPEIEGLRLAANNRLRSAGPIFFNGRGESVGFDDLDFGRQVGFLMFATFPMDRPEARLAYKRRSKELPAGEGRALTEGVVDEEGGTGVDSEEVDLMCSTHSSEERAGIRRPDPDLELQQPTPTTLSPRNSEAADRQQQTPIRTPLRDSDSEDPLPTPYEIFSYTDETRTTVRRRQPSIERNWHASKCRKSLSEMVWEEVGGERGGVYTKAALYFGPKRQAERRSV
jgi:hypothetical protein